MIREPIIPPARGEWRLGGRNAASIYERDSARSDKSTSAVVPPLQDSEGEVSQKPQANALADRGKALDYAGKGASDLPIIERKGNRAYALLLLRQTSVASSSAPGRGLLLRGPSEEVP